MGRSAHRDFQGAYNALFPDPSVDGTHAYTLVRFIKLYTYGICDI